MLLVGYGTDSNTGLNYWCVCFTIENFLAQLLVGLYM